ncbi:MAG: hypothetical protein GYA24_14145, partial [Candidatus Lokiarchaeota archaeon]|nr:hypothetical protein [Candidatus Lokiarchaeota archaeon]
VIDIGNGSAPIFLVVLLAVSLFFGSWAGFFLMVSAVGNMISMAKGLERGQNASDLAMKQVIGGVLLLVFAYLTEGTIGYHGAIGDLVTGNFTSWWATAMYRGYHMETIHAVAWCVIINGIVQAILSMNAGFKQYSRNIKIYAILAIAVIAATQFVWWGFDAMVPGGDFSHGTNLVTGHSWQYGDLLRLDFLTNFLLVFVQPWAGQVEPLFPFLAVSFIGSMIGLYLVKPRAGDEGKNTKTLHNAMAGGFFLMIGGFVIVMVILLFRPGDPVDGFLTVLRKSYDVTDLEQFGVWLPWFLMVTGAQWGAICLLLRLVEFRGKSAPFARKTLFFRRFGFVAFSVYNYQFLDVLPVMLAGMILGFPAWPLQRFYTVTIWLALALIIVTWAVVLWLWEKVDYVFGLEWLIAKISGVIIPSKRRVRKEAGGGRLPWWKTERLDPQGALHDAEWINIVDEKAIDHEGRKDSKLAFKMAMTGWIFFPGFLVGLAISKESKKTEGLNPHNKAAGIVSIVGIAWVIAFFTITLLLPTSILFG